MLLKCRGDSGATAAAARLGTPSSVGERHRAFQVRRIDTIARWLLSFAGEAVPVSPPRLVEEYAATAHATPGIYRNDP
jgi:hypothetical protein